MRRAPAPRGLLLLAGGFCLLAACTQPPPPPGTPPASVILIVGDGLGIAHITLARHALHGPGGRLALEGLPVVGLMSVHSASNAVTDSGAAATALAAGVKTGNNVVGLDSGGRPVRTITDLAKEAGWRIGYVTSTRITHATPASFYAHHRDRYADCDIAAQLLEKQPDVVLGGGMDWFDPAASTCAAPGQRSPDLLARARASGYEVWRSAGDLRDPPPARLLGLFAPGHLSLTIDNQARPRSDRQPTLRRLTETALAALSTSNGPFFLLVEGGRIDHAGHHYDAAALISEVAAFDDAVAAVLAYQRRHPDTLVVLTADHSTGGLAINDFTDWQSLRRQKVSVEIMVDRLCSGAGDARSLPEWTGWPGFAADVDAICAGDNVDTRRRRLGSLLSERNGVTWVPRVSTGAEGTEGHTGEDVPLYAGGPGAERFAGVLDNTDVARRIVDLLGWKGLG